MAVAVSMAWLGSVVQRGDPAGWQQLAAFRAGWHGCLRRWGDALFGLADAVACAGGPVTSLPRLSLLPAPRVMFLGLGIS